MTMIEYNYNVKEPKKEDDLKKADNLKNEINLRN